MATEFAEGTMIKEQNPKKAGFFGRFRRGTTKSNKAVNTSEERDEAVQVYQVDEPVQESFRAQEPEKMKHVRFPVKDAMKNKLPIRSEVRFNKPPAAREAAFGGPPRYDWIDIETAAAIKVQSVVRRNKTMSDLERQGITTAAIRNRSRRRKARMEARGNSGSADIPNLFACCGVGLAFGDATEEDYNATRQYQREQYLERKKEKEAREEELRTRFKNVANKKKAARSTSDVEEVLEVVE